MPTDPLPRLLDIMARLRDPEGGCPWDLEQTFASIAPYTIEEAYEVADAIERGDHHDLRDELGDLLFQVVFHARMAEEQGLFDFNAVAQSISDKMVRRHPHVFGDAEIGDAAAQTRNWEAIKQAEREARGEQDDSVLAHVSTGLPPIKRAMKLQARAATVGFDWPEAVRVLEKFREEADELAEAIDSGDQDHIEEEFGDLMLVMSNLARKLSLDPDRAMRRGNAKFERRFRALEALAAERGLVLGALDLDEQEALYQEVKRIQAAEGSA
ncbi:MAG: nucleoside triphosphate pyrophosphohydrolase [Wenzhouxiangella sp.]